MREGWIHTELGAYIDLLTGYPFKSSEYSEDGQGIRLVRGDNVIQGSIRWEDARYWPENKIDGLERYQLEVDDLVVALDRTWVKAGLKAATIQHADLPCLLVQRVARIRCTAALDQRFLAAIIQSHRFVEMVKSSKTETAVPHISPNDIRQFVIELPPLPEQRKIAGILQTWDTTIQKTEQLIAAKERRFKVLRERLVASPRKDVSALTIERRETMRFGDIFALSKEVAKAGSSLEVLSVTTGGIVRQSEYFNKQVASEDKSGYLIVRRGQLVMSGLNFWMGSIDFQTICEVGIVSPAYKVFSVVGAGLDIDYLRHYVRSSEMRKFLAMSSVQGASIVRRNLDMDQLMDSRISIPNAEKQRSIAAALNAMAQELELLGEQCAALKAQKRALMQKLLTGQWRLSVQGEAN